MRLKSYLRGIGIGVLVTAAVFIISGSAGKNTSMTDEQIISRAKELGMVEASTTLAEQAHTEQTEVAAVDSSKKDNDTEEVSKNDAEATGVIKTTEEVKPTKEAEATVTEGVNTTQEVKVTEEVKPTEEIKTENEKITETVKPSDNTATEEKNSEDKKEADAPADEKESEDKTAETALVETKEDGKEVIIVVNSGDGSGTVSRKLYEAGIIADANEYDQYLMANGYDRTITVGNHKISVTASKEEIAKNLTSPANK